MLATLYFFALVTIAQVVASEGVAQTSSNPSVLVHGQKWIQVTPTTPLSLVAMANGDLRVQYLPFVTAKGTAKYKLFLETNTKRYAINIETVATPTLVKGPTLYAGKPTLVTLALSAGDSLRIVPQQGATGGGVQYAFTPRRPTPAPIPPRVESPAPRSEQSSAVKEQVPSSTRAEFGVSAQRRLYARAALGYRAGLGEVSSLELRADAGKLYPLSGAHALDFHASLGVYGDAGTLRTRTGGFRQVSDWSVVAVPIGVTGAYRYAMDNAALCVGAAMEAHLLFADITTTTDEPGVGTSDRSNSGVAFGPRLFVVAGVAVGPGELFLEGFLSAPVWNNDVARYTGTLTATGGLFGYRYFFEP